MCPLVRVWAQVPYGTRFWAAGTLMGVAYVTVALAPGDVKLIGVSWCPLSSVHQNTL